MSNFKSLLTDILIEKGKTFADLENAGIISERTFYQYKDYTPYLPTILAIANFLKVSLDYLADRTNDNDFKIYKIPQTDIYVKIEKELKSRNINKSQLEKATGISRSNFSYWKKGTLPKFNTLITLASFLKCPIDTFLDFQ